jgi:hypothetical protein
MLERTELGSLGLESKGFTVGLFLSNLDFKALYLLNAVNLVSFWHSNTKQLSRLTPSWCAVTDLAKMVADPEEVPPGEAGELDSARVLVRA